MGNSNLHIWLQASRPLTLTAAIIPVIAGVALARADTGVTRWPLFWLALLGAIFIQIGTNLVNDAKDFQRGADTADRLGPQRVTQAGLLSAASVMRGSWISFAFATLCGIPLVIAGGMPIAVIGITSVIAAYAYTGGPYPLGYHGFGELFVILFFGLVAVGGTYYLQADSYSADAFVAGLAVGCLSSVLLAVNNLRDESGDRVIGKKTLVVRYGRRFGIVEIAALSLLPFALGLYWWIKGFPVAALLPLLSLPLALVIIRRAVNDSGVALNRVLKLAAALHASYGVLLSLGLWMSTA
ncbi:MAG TPA: 1,4-dihydroxy-2-naphthoate polyprenyltransferase [Thermoanaerobaculia bacterium]|nr:1,4-dihydroxy-2-naphthoate polyprenyltransferase [Thermoanaerobaculia bacterium]